MKVAFIIHCGNHRECPPWAAFGEVAEGMSLPHIVDLDDLNCPTCGYDDQQWEYFSNLDTFTFENELKPGKPFLLKEK